MSQFMRLALAAAVVVAVLGAAAFDKKPPPVKRAIRVHDRAQALRLCGRGPGRGRYECLGHPGDGPHGQVAYGWVEVPGGHGGASWQDDWFVP